MSDDGSRVVIKSGPAHTFGWMRRPEFDKECRPGDECWEMPDGLRICVAPMKDEHGKIKESTVTVQQIVGFESSEVGNHQNASATMSRVKVERSIP